MLGRFSTSVDGKRILIDPGSGSLTMYNEKNLIVAEISFKTPDSTSTINSSFTQLELFNYDGSYTLYEHSIITPGGISIESRQFSPDKYLMNIDPYGITFRKNRTVTKVISNE